MEQINGQNTGKASNYISRFKKLLLLSGFLKVVLYCRVSRCQQEENGNHKDQRRYMLRMIRRYEKKYRVRVKIIKIYYEVASGWDKDRPELIKAAQTAKKYDAVIVAESSCRFVRNRLFHSNKNPDVLPTTYDYEKLMKDGDGAILATIKKPDAPWKKVKSYEVSFLI